MAQGDCLSALGIHRRRLSHILTHDVAWQTALEVGPYHISLKVEDLSDSCLTLTVFGRTIILDGKANTVTLAEMQAPLHRGGTSLDLCLIVDRCSMELFLDDGAIYLGGVTRDTVSDYRLPLLQLKADMPCTVDTLVLHPLRSIW